MPKAKRLPSGSWNCIAYAGKGPDGKRKYESFTAPTKKECEYLAAQWQMQRSTRPADRSLGEAVDAYIRDNTGVLSPSTIVKYKSMRRNYFGAIESTPLRRVTSDLVQGWISKEMTQPANPMAATAGRRFMPNFSCIKATGTS